MSYGVSPPVIKRKLVRLCCFVQKMSNKVPYKYCIVPKCTNSSIKTPEKLFFQVPRDPAVRKQWCVVMRRVDTELSSLSNRLCCEDHFDVENDMENYMKYKLMGGCKLILKKGIVPHKFECQKPWRKKKRRSSVNAKEENTLEPTEGQGSSNITVKLEPMDLEDSSTANISEENDEPMQQNTSNIKQEIILEPIEYQDSSKFKQENVLEPIEFSVVTIKQEPKVQTSTVYIKQEYLSETNDSQDNSNINIEQENITEPIESQESGPSSQVPLSVPNKGKIIGFIPVLIKITNPPTAGLEGTQLQDKKESINKTNAQMCRDYRARKREAQKKIEMENVDHLPRETLDDLQTQNSENTYNKSLERNKTKEQERTASSAKTNAQRCREYRLRKKAKKQEETVECIESKTNQIAAEYNIIMKECGQKNQNTILHSLLVDDQLKTKKRKTDDCYNVSDTEKYNSQSDVELPRDTNDRTLFQKSFQTPYEQRNNCAQTNTIFEQHTDIPTDGNCFFHSVIKMLNLSLTPLEIRQQLLTPAFLNSCINPTNARKILESATEYADMDCIDIFTRAYNQNVCVHNYYINTITGEQKHYLHFKINDSDKFLHLHQSEGNFTPLIECTIDLQNEEKAKINTEMSSDEDDLSDDVSIDNIEVNIPIYTNYHKHDSAHLKFHNTFKRNTFGHACGVCSRLWWKRDLKKSKEIHEFVLQKILPNYVRGKPVDICLSCKKSMSKKRVPMLATYNCFSFPTIPTHLPKLNLIEQLLISPRIPFMQIRSLNDGQFDDNGQIINVPIEENTMVKQLPRNIKDDHYFDDEFKNKLIHKTSYVHGLINKENIRQWLHYLVKTPLYIQEKITINEALLNSYGTDSNDVSKHVPNEDNITAQQQSLLWNKNKKFPMAGRPNLPRSILFEKYAEELSFPTIYGGQFRTYRDGVNATPFMQVTSELRRADRRATHPQHVLYVAIKMMWYRVRISVKLALQHVDLEHKMTTQDVQSEDYINSCIETNLSFLSYVPNSAWYWAEQKNDLFAIIRQFGPPTVFMRLSANDGWTDLLKLLYKLKNNGTVIDNKALTEMSNLHKAQLVNEDAITCAIYFHKLVICLLNILQSKKRNPFGKFIVNNYYKRIVFEGGSPQAHVFLWLNNVSKDTNSKSFIDMVDSLVSVSVSEASGNIELQTHKHTHECYKNDPNKRDCIFDVPYLPSRKTIMLLPLKETSVSVEKYNEYKNHYASLKTNLEENDYLDVDHFYAENNVTSDKHYYDIIRAGIDRPTLLHRRSPSEKWHIPFNPFVFHCLQSNMDFQIIHDEYSCAVYVAEYINNYHSSICNLQRLLTQIIDRYPKFDIKDVTKQLSNDILRAVKMTAQEAAWYSLREPVAKSSVATVYIPTIHPTERQRIRNTLKGMSNSDSDCSNTWKVNWFNIYETRPKNLENITLAQYVANYNGKTRRTVSSVIKYRNYDGVKNSDDYKREMVLLHVPFRSEENEVLAGNKYKQIYEEKNDLILKHRTEFESDFDIEKTIEICKQLGSNGHALQIDSVVKIEKME